jgi:hypothetical protein
MGMLAGVAHAADSRPFYMPQPIVTGDLELGLGVFDPATGPNMGVFTGTGRANVPIQRSLNLEVQMSGFALHDDGLSMQWTDAYGHAWHRLPSSAWGVFGGSQFGGVMTHTVGIEAKHYIGNVSLGGEAAYLWRSVGSSSGWEVAGAVNLYLHPNFRIGGGAQYVSGFAADLTTLALEAELRIPTSPWSVWGYAASFDAGGSTSYVALGGLKVFMDAPGSTLQSHEKDVPFWFHSPPPLLVP